LSAEARALKQAHGLSDDESRVIAHEPALRALFDAAIATEGGVYAKPVAQVLVNDLLGELRARRLDAVPFGGEAVVELVRMAQTGEISSTQAKEVLAEMVTSGASARTIAAARGMKQIASPDALGPLVDAVLSENADAVARFRAGNINVMGALVGLVMKKTQGQANAKVARQLLEQKLKA